MTPHQHLPDPDAEILRPDPDVSSVPRESEAEILPPSDEKTTEWIAALSAAGFDYRLTHAAAGWKIHVAEPVAAAARAEIEAYETENRNWPPQPHAWPEQPFRLSGLSALWVCGFIAAFHVWLGPFREETPGMRAAAADAERIVAGDWWRAITALTLHANIEHLMANLIGLFLLGSAVSRRFGSGLGWALILATGVAGNACVALLLQSNHLSVGASTSCFGALGLLAACRAIQNLQQTGGVTGLWDRTWLPIGAGISLLAMLGTGPHSDLAAHALGFLFGLLLAVPFCWNGIVRLPDWLQRTLQIATLCIVMTAWRMALRSAE